MNVRGIIIVNEEYECDKIYIENERRKLLARFVIFKYINFHTIDIYNILIYN